MHISCSNNSCIVKIVSIIIVEIDNIVINNFTFVLITRIINIMYTISIISLNNKQIHFHLLKTFSFHILLSKKFPVRLLLPYDPTILRKCNVIILSSKKVGQIIGSRELNKLRCAIEHGTRI